MCASNDWEELPGNAAEGRAPPPTHVFVTLLQCCSSAWTAGTQGRRQRGQAHWFSIELGEVLLFAEVLEERSVPKGHGQNEPTTAEPHRQPTGLREARKLVDLR